MPPLTFAGVAGALREIAHGHRRARDELDQRTAQGGDLVYAIADPGVTGWWTRLVRALADRTRDWRRGVGL